MEVLIVVIAVALLIILGAARSFHSIGPAEVGLVTKRLGRKLGEDQLVAAQRRGRLPGRPPHARTALQAVADLQGRALPVGAGRRPTTSVSSSPRSAQPLPTGAKSAVYRAPSSAASPTSGRSSPTAASGACSARSCPRARRRRSTRSGSSSSPATEAFGKVVSETDAAAIAQVDPGAAEGHAHHPPGRPRHRRRRHHARGSAVGRHRQPHRRLQRRHRHGVDRRGLARARSSRRCCGRRTTSTTTTRTTRRSSTTAAASASSTTRCSTARTCSTRSS